jgi:hypothetical protein
MRQDSGEVMGIAGYIGVLASHDIEAGLLPTRRNIPTARNPRSSSRTDLQNSPWHRDDFLQEGRV